MEEDGFISNITIGNTFTKQRKSALEKRKDKKQKYLERKIIKKQNRKKYEEIIEKKKEARLNNNRNKSDNNIHNFRKEDYNEIKKNNNDYHKDKDKHVKDNEIKVKIKENMKESTKESIKENIKEKKLEIKKEEENKEEEIEVIKEDKNRKMKNEKKDDIKEEKLIKENKTIGKKDIKNENNYIENESKKEEKNNDNDNEKKQIDNNIKENDNNIKSNKKKNSSQTIFSIKSFEDLKINPYLKKALNKSNYNIMTKIQKKAIPILLEHKNVIVKSETGSGKTLAYIIPLYQYLFEINEIEKISRKNGIYSIIFSPTHELCLQIEKTFDKLKSCCINVVYGSLMGGQKIETEKKKLRKGLNVIITTPGRLLYHLQNTENINFTTLKMIIIDEADLMLDMGFEKDIKECFKLIVKKSENIANEEEIVLNPDYFKKFKIFLISATIDNRIRKMSNYFMKGFKAIGFEKEDDKDKVNNKINEEKKDNEKDINNDKDRKEENINKNYYLSALKQQNITQYYSYINDEYRLIHLIAFLYNNLYQKAIIFVSTCDLCEYLSKIITDLEIDINYKSDIIQTTKDKKNTKSKSSNDSKFINLFN